MSLPSHPGPLTGPPAPVPGAQRGPGPLSTPRALLTGAFCLPRGLRRFLGTPGLRLRGIVPAVLTLLLVSALFGGLLASLPFLVGALTPFADRWDPDQRTLLQLGVGTAITALAGMLLLVSFVTLTNLVGQPFYEQISDGVERRLGPPPPGADTSWWRTLPAATAQSVATVLMAVALTVPVLPFGLIPVVGQAIVSTWGALVGGFMLALELTGIPLERRRFGFRDRIRFVWRHRAYTVGFGLAVFLLFLVPLMGALAMPGAVVGGTLLVRRLTGMPDRFPSR